MTPTTPFVCYCADSKVRFPDWHFDEIRKDVCQDLPFYGDADGKQYCVLHYPRKDKAEDFEMVFRQRIDQGKWDFRMAWFPAKLEFENHTFNHDANFSSATFGAGVRFRKCKFEGKFEFFDSKFLELGEFRYSEFSKFTNFHSAQFMDYGDFGAAHFDEGAWFKSAHFYKASFQGTEFHGEVDFTKATITDHARFSQAKCFSKAIFIKIVFPKETETIFNGAEFHHEANFDEAAFGQTDFKWAKFGLSSKSPFEKTTFTNAKFNDGVRFSDAQFLQGVDFGQASFTMVGFERTRFHCEARFTQCDFTGLTYFHDAEFGTNTSEGVRSADVYFDYARFHDTSRIFFQNTWFSRFVTFDYTIIKGYVFFQGGRTNRVFDHTFEEQDFRSLVTFKNTVIEKPERLHFHSVRLRPHWFLNVDCRKFNLNNISWLDERQEKVNESSELNNLRKWNQTNPERLLTITLRQLAVNAEEHNRFEEASMFRRMTLETEWIERKKKVSQLYAHVRAEIQKQKELSGMAQGYTPIPPSSILAIIRRKGDTMLHLLYRLSSFYGESWGRAARVLLLILFGFAFLYTGLQFYICPSDKPITQSTQQNLCETRTLSAPEAIRHSLAIATFQTPEYRRPTTATGETLTMIERILAPIQAALLALAIRRRFMR